MTEESKMRGDHSVTRDILKDSIEGALAGEWEPSNSTRYEEWNPNHPTQHETKIWSERHQRYFVCRTGPKGDMRRFDIRSAR